MLHAKAFAKNPAGSCVCVVEKFMLPHCILQECFVFVLRMLLKKQFVMRALRRVRQSVWRRRACVRRDTPTYTVSARLSPERPSKEPSRRVETPCLITTTLFSVISHNNVLIRCSRTLVARASAIRLYLYATDSDTRVTL